jgi:hypothetical protein
MKRFTNILVALGVTLFLLTVGMKSEAEAQPCTNVKDTLTIAGCQYEIDLCVYCGLSYPGYIEIDTIRTIDPNCVNHLSQEQLIKQAFLQLYNEASIWLKFCQPLVPPYDGPLREIIEWRMPFCWKLQLVHITVPIPPDTEFEYTYNYIPCSKNEYCAVEVEYCRDKNGVLQHTVNNNVPTGFPLCRIEGYDLDKPIIYIGEESDCFILHTPCNP